MSYSSSNDRDSAATPATIRCLLYIATTLVLLGPGSALADTWLCESATGHRYKVSQSVPTDSCRKLLYEEIGADLASLPMPPRSNPRWGIERFCKAQKPGACIPSEDAVERGALGGVWLRLTPNGADVEGAAADSPDAGTGNWTVSCRRDKMTSARSCLVYKDDLYVGVYGNGRLTFSVGDEHFPGSQSSIRIGSRRFDTGQRDGYFPNAPQLVQLMKNGTPVVTRYMKWPYREWIDKEFVSYGLGTAIQAAHWILKHGDLG